MNALKKTLAVTSLVLTLPVIATTAQAFETSANVTLTTDYKFRGISQNDTSPAIQGGFDIAFENGIYIGTWASMVDFQDPDSSDADFSPYGSRDLDYQEVYASVSYSNATLGFAYSDDYWLETGDFVYVYGDYSLSLPHEFSLDFHYGFNSFEFDSDDSNPKDASQAFLGDGEDSYSDYSITLNKSFSGLDFSLSWIDTDLDKDECWGTDWCDSSVVFAISKSL